MSFERFTDALLDDIKHQVPISRVVGDYVIWDKKKSQARKGDFWACCPFHGEKSPSFHADDRRAQYHCFGCGVTGDHFKFLTEKTGLSFPDAVARVAGLAGISLPNRERRDETEQEKADREARMRVEAEDSARRRAAAQVETEKDKQRRAETAAGIWAETKPLAGTHAEAYLVARGIPPVVEWPWDPKDTLRFHPALRYPDAGKFPALVCRVQDAWGETVGVWRIFLSVTSPEKADVPDAKLGLGPVAGGAIRIGGDAPDIGAAEGAESALGAYALEDFRRPVWALMSTSGMRGFEPPMFIVKLRVWQDSDFGKFDKTGVLHEPPGITAARDLRARLIPTGIKCIIQNGQVHGDALDLLLARKQHEKSA